TLNKTDTKPEGDPVSDGSKNGVALVDDVIQKKMKRAERFGMPVQLSEQEKRNSRAHRRLVLLHISIPNIGFQVMNTCVSVENDNGTEVGVMFGRAPTPLSSGGRLTASLFSSIKMHLQMISTYSHLGDSHPTIRRRSLRHRLCTSYRDTVRFTPSAGGGWDVHVAHSLERYRGGGRFGTVPATQGLDKKAQELKLKARAERFGITKSTPADEDEKKKARLARFASAANADTQEEQKKKARALRFSGSQVNASGKIESVCTSVIAIIWYCKLLVLLIQKPLLVFNYFAFKNRKQQSRAKQVERLETQLLSFAVRIY
ncbi:hypothetical protein Tco_0930386, partial [Tanacetum coccineum]